MRGRRVIAAQVWKTLRTTPRCVIPKCSPRPMLRRSRHPTVELSHPILQCEFAERRKFYTEYVPFWASFGICIQEYVWNTSGILRIRAEYSPLGGLRFQHFWNTWNTYSHSRFAMPSHTW